MGARAFIDAFDIGGLNEGQSTADVAISGDGKVWCTGYFRADTVDLDPGSGTANVFNAGGNDIFVAGYSYPHPLGIVTPEALQLKIHPTITNYSITIDAEQQFSNAVVSVKTVEGRVAFSNTVDRFPFSMPVAELPTGVYVISCLAGGKVYSAKFVKE